jgi:hypothetical protein
MQIIYVDEESSRPCDAGPVPFAATVEAERHLRPCLAPLEAIPPAVSGNLMMPMTMPAIETEKRSSNHEFRIQRTNLPSSLSRPKRLSTWFEALVDLSKRLSTCSNACRLFERFSIISSRFMTPAGFSALLRRGRCPLAETRFPGIGAFPYRIRRSIREISSDIASYFFQSFADGIALPRTAM